MTSVDSNLNFLCGRPHGAGPPVHMRPPEPDPTPPFLRVDVINGWSLYRDCAKFRKQPVELSSRAQDLSKSLQDPKGKFISSKSGHWIKSMSLERHTDRRRVGAEKSDCKSFFK